ncbi:MaoC family dehydratase N-terminal domain-containing protein [uncultured Ferrovibrio sp.]|jgi:3-methylfumaryl-CoA hydratase|uniref:FAS1-like dehydratase domain-containing protein n=1 Tax=uncultured Ferrovibrio sp. TaxID=1576913 RepID=UPI00262B5D73|nr:MaoC family dehydratase N-terminal domain-containing protein [uncultured Ferrovibrio sp.]
MAKPELKDWVGGSEEAADILSPEKTNALAAALDQPAVTGDNALLPPLRHWLYFWTVAPRRQLGRDGHPALGGFLPDVGKLWGSQTRRMWAGSRIGFHRPLMLGMPVRRISTVESAVEKKGRSGRLVFVTVRHEIFDETGARAITDRHDIVYREEKLDGAGTLPPPEPAPADHHWEDNFIADPVLLFRYSALTFNGHRIHYDRDYAMRTEGYGGLVVHGPLLATLLVDFAASLRPGQALLDFSFRGRRPVLDGQPFLLRAKPLSDDTLSLWIADAEGALAMTAEAQFR